MAKKTEVKNTAGKGSVGTGGKKKTRGGSVASAKTTKRAARKVVDPMLVNAEEAEEHNVVLDGALADLEMAQEAAEADLSEGATDEFDEDYLNEVLSEEEDEELGDILEISDKDLDDKKGKKSKKDNKKSKKDKKGKKAPKLKKNGKPKMKLWKKILIVFLLILVAVGAYVAWYLYSILDKTSTVFEGNALDILTSVPLKEDENGRSNILVFGTSEDNEEHNGAMLADSILVVSMNQNTKEAKTFSIPRDLWVNYTVNGDKPMSCWVGYKGKINAEYMCALTAFSDDSSQAARYFAKKVSEITGVDIQYYVAVDWTVLTTIVDTLGGIDVDVWATDSRGISDVCQQLVLPKGMNKNLDGDKILRLARARGACYPSWRDKVRQNYGLMNSNFDREKNQQRIMNSIKDKALSLGILADPTKVLTMIDALGNNVRTNISMSEVRTILDVAMGMEGDITSVPTQDLFSTGTVSGQSVVIPRGASASAEATLYNYTNLQTYFKEELVKTKGSEGDATDKSGSSSSSKNAVRTTTNSR